jgi:hypothetical protein
MIAVPFIEFWRGERPFGLRPGRIGAVKKGHVVLTGTVEPAWSVLISPFAGRHCAWYDARSEVVYGRRWRGNGRTSITAFLETNAVPFVLNDGTGRILVLGRRAHWDGSTQPKGEAETNRGMADPTSGATPSGHKHERHREVPPPLHSWVWDGVAKAQIDEYGKEAFIAFGDVVTIVGRAVPYRISATSDKDGCVDGGRSLGLPADFIVGPRLITGLDILSGTPRQIRRSARLGLAIGLTGAVAMLVSIYFLANIIP